MDKHFKPRELNGKERRELKKLGYDYRRFCFLDKDAESITFLDKETGKQLILYR